MHNIFLNDIFQFLIGIKLLLFVKLVLFFHHSLSLFSLQFVNFFFLSSIFELLEFFAGVL